MKAISLPQGTVVTTRFIAPVHFLASPVEGFDRETVPEMLLGWGVPQPVGLGVRRRCVPYSFDCPPPGSGFTLTESFMDVWLVADRIAIVEVVLRYEAQEGAVLEADAVQAHWLPFYKSYGSLEEVALAGTELSGLHSSWQSPLTLITGMGTTSEIIDGIVEVGKSAVGESPTVVRAACCSGAVTWDGALFVLPVEGERYRPALEFLQRAIAADWEFHEKARSTAREVLASKSNTADRLERIRAAITRFHTSVAITDPTALCYQESDRAFLLGISEAWGREELHASTTQLMDRLHQLYQLDVDAEREAHSVRLETHNQVLNRVVAWLALLGVASTVATIVSTVDYSNELFGHQWRVLAIAVSTALTIAAFAYLLGRAAYRRWG